MMMLQKLEEKMAGLDPIETLVQEYKPRIEAIFGLKIGDVKVDYTLDEFDSLMAVTESMMHVRTMLKGKAVSEEEKRAVAHELAHILDNNNNLNLDLPAQNYTICGHMREGFAEYVASEYPEIYKDEKGMEKIAKIHEEQIKEYYEIYANHWAMKRLCSPYIKGYEFFKKVGQVIGRKNILKVFKNPPQSMEEILEPENYLKRIGEIRNIPKGEEKIRK